MDLTNKPERHIEGESNTTPLLTVDDLRVRFDGAARPTLNGISFGVRDGEALAVVGESGSGKTLTSRAIIGLLPKSARIVGGDIHFAGGNLGELSQKEWLAIRGHQIGFVFQDAMAALNPVLRVGWQISEVLRTKGGMDRREARDRCYDLLSNVGLTQVEARMRAYPHELSGGMRQRVMIAMAMALNPTLLIADEPTSALDVTTQAEILGVLKELRVNAGMSLIFITHDLAVAAQLADRIVVVYRGEVVEEGPARLVLGKPTHPYTSSLLRAVPPIDRRLSRLPVLAKEPLTLTQGK